MQSILELDAASLGDGFVAIPPHRRRRDCICRSPISARGIRRRPRRRRSRVIARARASSRSSTASRPSSRLVEDLDRAGHPGHGAQFTGWAFNRFVLNEQDDRDLVEIASRHHRRQAATCGCWPRSSFRTSRTSTTFHDRVLGLLALSSACRRPSAYPARLLEEHVASDDAGFVVALLVPRASPS